MSNDLQAVYENTMQAVNTDADGLATSNGYGLASFYYANHDNDFIAPYGVWRRNYQLRKLYYAASNTLVSGALSNLGMRIRQVPWELSGGRNNTSYFQSIMQHADFGAGWDSFLSRVLQDFLTLDNGAFIEVIGRGEPDAPIEGRVLGVAHLDGLRCYRTDNAEYPIYYQNDDGKLFKVHRTRVYMLTDNPNPDPDYYGLGFSALSRAIAVAQQQTLMSRYMSEKMSDLPPNGFVTISNISAKEYEDAKNQYEKARKDKGITVFPGLMRLQGIDPNNPAKIEITPFSNVPDGFNYSEYLSEHVRMLALAIGDDPLEIWPLTGQGLSTGSQSKVLHAKGKARIFGAILTQLERMINISLLPASLEFKFKPKDTEQDKAEAEKAQFWMNVAMNGINSGAFNPNEARQLLANTVEAYADVLLDDAGQVRLPDDDVQDESQEIAPDDATTEPITDDTEQDDATARDNATVQTGARYRVAGHDRTHDEYKAIQATRLDFEDAFEDLLRSAVAADIDRRRFGIRARAIISRAVRQAYLDGLEDGGVNRADLSNADSIRIRQITADQSVYVTNIGVRIFQDGKVTLAEVANKPSMWFNKSIEPAYQAGRLSANRNGYYEWVYGDTEHCSDCRTLNGQIHRLRDYHRSGWLPKADKLECKGFNCKCNLRKRTGVRARGRFPSGGKAHTHA